jgi:aldehyde dehydrogenase (NAD+)
MNATNIPTVQLQIGDRFLDTGSGGTFDHVNPATGRVQAQVPLAGKNEVNEAVEAACAAFEIWRRTPPVERRNCLNRLAALIRDNAEEFARLGAIENGTPVAGGMVGPMITEQWVSYYAGWADKIDGQVNSTWPSDQFSYTIPEPYGVIGIIITWNGPLISLGMKAAPALAAGNAVVIKPAEITPWCAALFGKLTLEAGIPPGVVNIIPGSIDAGETLVRHPNVQKISFTGGPIAARKIQAAAADQIKPLVFELGGKSANLVFEDADLDRVVEQAVNFSICYMSGQGCAFPTRLLVQRSIYDEVLKRVEEQAGRIAAGDPMDPQAEMGPVVNGAACERIMAMIEDATRTGKARLLTGGERFGGEFADGYYIQPTVFADVDPYTEIAQQEVFGPVLCVTPFEDEAEAIAIANSTEYGLASYVQTSNLSRALRLASELRSGTVYINGALMIQPQAPFGGEGVSGYGREGAKAGLDEYIRLKTVAVANIDA